MWPSLPLGDIAEIYGGSTPRRNHDEFWNGDIPWVTPTDLPKAGEGIADLADTTERITQEGLGSCAAKLLPVGTVLFSSRASIGKIGIAAVPLATNQGFVNFVPRDGLDSRYLAYCLQFQTNEIAALAGSTTFKEMSRGAVKKFRIPVPTILEQKRIVEILDQADVLRKQHAEADAKFARILSALFYKMFGDPATNPKGWPTEPLGQLCLGPPQYGANSKAVEYKEGMPRYVRITDINERGQLIDENLKSLNSTYWEQYQLEEGDLLFARSGATVGKSYMYREQDGLCAFAGYLIRFQLDKNNINPWVVFAYTQTLHYKNWVTSKQRAAAQPNINGQEYASLQIMQPKSELQQQFADRMIKIFEINQENTARSKKIESLFGLLLHRAFSGELTAKWRDVHMKELLQEIEHQARVLGQ